MFRQRVTHDCASILDSIAKGISLFPRFFAWCIPTSIFIHFYTCIIISDYDLTEIEQTNILVSIYSPMVAKLRLSVFIGVGSEAGEHDTAENMS